MDKIDFLAINQECERYLYDNKNSLYSNYMEAYLRKAKELLKCPTINIPNITSEEIYIDLLEGIKLIYEYLNELKPDLAKKFMTEFKNGQIEINYMDEDVWIEEKAEGNWHFKNFSNKQIKENNKKENTITTAPISLIDIENRKTTYSLLPIIIHEFFHSISIKDKNNNYETYICQDLTEMISIFFEFNFINWMIQKGYNNNQFLVTYYERYTDTINKNELQSFLNQTIFLYKKITEGILDETSYKIGKYTCSENYFMNLCKKSSLFLAKENQKEEKMQDFQYLKEERKPLFTTEKHAHYIIGAPLAYHLSCSQDPLMPQKMISFVEEINSLPLIVSLQKIDLSLTKIENLNYTNIMENMLTKILDINKTPNNGNKKSLTKI